MKRILIFVFLLLTSALRAQVPHIDYMMADEAKSQLQIHGKFSSDTTGFVTIENTKQTVRFWSDTMLICDLPDSGAGSGGHVTVSQMSGISNSRMLSIFQGTIDHAIIETFGSSSGYQYLNMGYCDWIFSWRADILNRPTKSSKFVPFEIAKSSFGKVESHAGSPVTDAILPWADSLNTSDSSISLHGYLDLIKYEIVFNDAMLNLKSIIHNSNETPLNCTPQLVNFDTVGNLSGYTYHNDKSINYLVVSDIFFDQKILFPPSIKNAINQSDKTSSDLIKISSNFNPEDHLISLETEEPLGEVTASLYSIEGRLFKQEKISMLSAGKYLFDASGLNSHFGFLELKTPVGIVAKKVLF